MSDSRFKDLPEDERPRERLCRHGAEVLSDAELLAIFLRTGKKGVNVMTLARGVMKEWGTLRRVAGCTLQEFAKVSGIGPAKASELKAAFEMGRRMARPEVEK